MRQEDHEDNTSQSLQGPGINARYCAKCFTHIVHATHEPPIMAQFTKVETQTQRGDISGPRSHSPPAVKQSGSQSSLNPGVLAGLHAHCKLCPVPQLPSGGKARTPMWETLSQPCCLPLMGPGLRCNHITEQSEA